jgi:hypothetical protein
VIPGNSSSKTGIIFSDFQKIKIFLVGKASGCPRIQSLILGDQSPSPIEKAVGWENTDDRPKLIPLRTGWSMPPDWSMKPELSPLKLALKFDPPLPESPPLAAPPDAAPLAVPPPETADWQTSVQKIYDRKTQERRPHYEGDPQRYRQVAAELSGRVWHQEGLTPDGLMPDELVDDSRTIAPSGYPALVLPSPRGSYPHWNAITGTTFLEHEIIKGNASTQRLDFVFAQVAWEVLQQYGIEAAYVLLLLTTRLVQARDPWAEIVELSTPDLLQLNIWERDRDLSRGQRLRMAGNWFELVCNLSLLVNRIDPVKSRFTALRIPFWVLEEMEYGGAVTGAIGGLEPEAAQDLTIRVGLGLWSEQFVATPDEQKRESLVQFGHQAGTVLQLDPHRKVQTAKLGILLMLLDRLHPGNPQFYAIGSILEHLESKATLIEWRRRKDRLQAGFSRWNTSLHSLQRLGWQITFEPESYPPKFQPIWHHPEGSSNPVEPDDDQWLDQWLQARVQITPPHFVRVEPELVELTLSDRFTGRNLAQALALKGLSQSKLADYLNLDRSMVTYWIKGARLIQPKHRARIYELLGEELAQVVV